MKGKGNFIEIPVVPSCASLDEYDSPVVWQGRKGFIVNRKAVARKMAKDGLEQIKIAMMMLGEEKAKGELNYPELQNKFDGIKGEKK